MTSITFYIDVHGVLVNSSKMIQNYENILINLYHKFNIPKDQAIKHHETGLTLFRKLLEEIKRYKDLSRQEFLFKMSEADKKWDFLMQEFVKPFKAPEIESRNVEFLAGT